MFVSSLLLFFGGGRCASLVILCRFSLFENAHDLFDTIFAENIIAHVAVLVVILVVIIAVVMIIPSLYDIGAGHIGFSEFSIHLVVSFAHPESKRLFVFGSRRHARHDFLEIL